MVRVGLIGYGYWGPKLARCLVREAGCELRAICDLSADRLAQAASDHPHVTTEQNWRRLVADPALDTIVIASPAGEHFAQTIAALESGKHALVEKPMALSSQNALAMIDLARRKNLSLLVDHTYVYSPAVRAIQAALRQGEIGQVREYISQRCNIAGSRQDADVVWDLAAHDIAIIEFLFPGAARAVCVAETDATTAGPPSRATLSVHLAHGLIARIHVDWAAGAKRRRVDIAGSRGVLLFDDLQPVKLWRTDLTHGRASAIALEEAEPLAMVVREFLADIRKKEKTPAAGQAALRVIELLETASMSLAKGGRLIEINSQDRALATAAK